MIKEIEIKNFQSYKDVKLEFSEGVNVIVGSTNSGKTAIIRALNWVLNNKPNGTYICSHWNIDEKGNIIDPYYVKLTNDKGCVERMRSKTFNGYLVDGKKLGAIKLDVPQDVKEMLNLEDVNMQYQMDSPFLLSMSGPEATRLLNKLVKLDCIDGVLSKSESQRRDLNSHIKLAESDLKKAEEKVESLSWTEQATNYISKIEVYEDKINDLKEEKKTLEDTTVDFRIKENELFDFTEADLILSDLEKIIADSENTNSELQQLMREENELNSLLQSGVIVDTTLCEDYSSQLDLLFEEYRNKKDELFELRTNVTKIRELRREIDDFSDVDMILPALEGIINTLNSSQNVVAVNLLKQQISQLQEYEKQLKEEETYIGTLEAEMPDICPYCGSALCKEN